MVWETWTAMVWSYLANVQSTFCASQMLSSIKLTSTNQLGCTQDPSSGTWVTLLLSSREISRMCGWPMPCVVQNSGWTMDLLDDVSSCVLFPHITSIPKSSDHHSSWPCWDTPTTTTVFWDTLDGKLKSIWPMLKTALGSGTSLKDCHWNNKSCFGS